MHPYRLPLLAGLTGLLAIPATTNAAPIRRARVKKSSPTTPATAKPIPSTNLGPKNRAGFMWQGFRVEWLATAAGFRMPHRFGSFDSRIVAQDHAVSSSKWTATADAKFEFTPGVDGDYAEPLLQYSLAYSPTVAVTRGKVNFAFTDDVVGDYDNPNSSGNFPKAETRARKRVSIPLNSKQNFGRYDNYAVVLRGVTIDMECAAGQPGKSCNSNGLWPHRLYVAIDDCTHSGGKLQCDFDLDIFRSWTPDKGGGKPLNDKMKFDVDVQYTVFGGNDGNFYARDTSLITRTGSIQAASMDTIRKTGSRTTTGQAGYKNATMGLTAFGFELKKTGNAKNRGHLGRYLSGLDFRIADRAYNKSTGSMDWAYRVAFWAPTTVKQSDVTYYMRGKLLQFGADSTVTSAVATPVAGKTIWLDRTASGKACMEGDFFKKCSNKGMPEDTKSTKAIRVVTPL